ncbi:hypothetical protein QQP08_012972 [Theobroma cacao]|nr:hypothetical protein QQP08_012972 [Theobroma cacao]
MGHTCALLWLKLLTACRQNCWRVGSVDEGLGTMCLCWVNIEAENLTLQFIAKFEWILLPGRAWIHFVYIVLGRHLSWTELVNMSIDFPVD